MQYRLLRDITAYDLAMDDPVTQEGGGYPPDHVIGPKGSLVTLVEEDGADWLYVCDFERDCFAQGYIARRDAELVGDSLPMVIENGEQLDVTLAQAHDLVRRGLIYQCDDCHAGGLIYHLEVVDGEPVEWEQIDAALSAIAALP